LALHKISL